MAGVALRHRWALDLLDLAGHESVLEIGCGHGIATGLACAALTSGHLTAIDRSATMTRACARRNGAAVAARQLAVLTGAFEDLALPRGLQRLFAVNVDFSLRDDRRWAERVVHVLAPDGYAVIVLESPSAATARRSAEQCRVDLEQAGLGVATLEGDRMLALVAAHRPLFLDLPVLSRYRGPTFRQA